MSERLKNFLRGWLLVLDIKEGLVECATVCVKSVVILEFMCDVWFLSIEFNEEYIGFIDLHGRSQFS